MATEGWQDNPDLKKIYVTKLKTDTTQDTLVDYFAKYGTVTECKIIKDKEDKPRGFAFLSMDDQAIIDTILEDRPHTIDGQTVYLRRAIPRDDPNPLAQAKTKKLFIGGLTEEASEQDIKDVLQIFTHHEPENIKLMRDKNTNKFKGYAFVMYSSEDVVDKLFIIRHCTIKNKRVELKKAEEIGSNQSVRGGGVMSRGGYRGGRSGGRGGGGGASAYTQSSYSGYEAQYDYGGGYGGGYDQGYDYNGYGGYSGYGDGYGGGYGMGQYGSEPSGYGPNRRGGVGRGRGGGGGGYRPY